MSILTIAKISKTVVEIVISRQKALKFFFLIKFLKTDSCTTFNNFSLFKNIY